MGNKTIGKKFIRNNDGTMTIPGCVLDIAPIFYSPAGESALDNLIALVGEDGCLTIGEYILAFCNSTQPELMGMLCEGFATDTPLNPIVKLLEKLPPIITLRALVTQKLCQSSPGLIEYVSPFYKAISGVKRL